jgi:protein SDA1
VLQQYRHYQSQLEIFKLNPSQDAKQLGELVNFMSAMATSYPQFLNTFPAEIISLLEEHHATMDSDLRNSLTRSLILLRNRELVAAGDLLQLSFKLFRCPDKPLREMLHNHIVSDIKRLNAKHKNNAVNKKLQNFMYTMLNDDNAIAVKKSLDVMVELYKKNVWNDQKTVNVIATACFSPIAKIMVTAIKFFLSADEEVPESEDEGDNGKPSYSQILHRTDHLKKTKKRKRILNHALRKENKKDKKSNKAEVFNFSALHLIHDPQGLAEKLFDFLKQTSERFEVRLMIMNFISRLIGVHQVLQLQCLAWCSFVFSPFSLLASLLRVPVFSLW